MPSSKFSRRARQQTEPAVCHAPPPKPASPPPNCYTCLPGTTPRYVYIYVTEFTDEYATGNGTFTLKQVEGTPCSWYYEVKIGDDINTYLYKAGGGWPYILMRVAGQYAQVSTFSDPAITRCDQQWPGLVLDKKPTAPTIPGQDPVVTIMACFN